MSDVNPTRVDILSLSDDDFGSKYGRDRTAKEVAMKNANDIAGYKAAEADFKKEQAASKGSRGGAAGSKIELEKGMMGSSMPKPKLASGGKVSSASKRADGCAVRGKTKGKMI